MSFNIALIAGSEGEFQSCEKVFCSIPMNQQLYENSGKNGKLLVEGARGWLAWFPQISAMAELVAYREKACWQNWMTALVDRSTKAVLKSRLLIRVAPRFMGWTVNMRRFRPTMVQPFTFTPARKASQHVLTKYCSPLTQQAFQHSHGKYDITRKGSRL